MPECPPEVIVKKLDVAWQLTEKLLQTQPLIQISTLNSERMEAFKDVYRAVSEAVQENDYKE